MNDQQKTRLAILAVSGVLLGGGIYGWIWYNNQKEQQAEMEQPTQVAHVRLPVKKVTPSGGTTATTSVGDNSLTPTTKPVAVASKPTPDTTSSGPNADLNNPNSAMSSAFKPMSNAEPNKLPNVRPIANAAGNGPPLPNMVKQAVDTKTVPVTAAAPAATPNPAMPGTMPGAQPAATAAPAPTPVVTGPMPATSIAEASKVAAPERGKADPMQQLGKFLPFPRIATLNKDMGGGATNMVPPPPPGADHELAHELADASAGAGKAATAPGGKTNISKHIQDHLVPPPPPTMPTASGADGLDLDIQQLPPPPSKPMIGDKMKVLAILDDHAVISFPNNIRSKNKWPKTITLATGEQFDSIKVVQVNADGVTIEEDGERSLKPLATIK